MIGSRGMGPGGQRTGGPSFWGGGELGAVSPYMVAKAGVCFGTGGGGGQSVTSYNNGALGADGVCLIFEHK